MMRSLFSGISGLRNFQTRMDIIGNNIANVNTIGFKGQRATFADVISQTLQGATPPSDLLGGVNPMQVGLGMRIAGVDTKFAQGSLESTGITTDLAIQGDGFFILSDGKENFYTRAGTFNVDADGNLVYGPNGFKVLGYVTSETTGELQRSGAQAIQIPLGRRSPASATSEITLQGNLDVNLTRSLASLNDAGTTGINSVSGIATNGVGGQHQIVVTGANATRSLASGVTQGLSLTDALSAHGVTGSAGFSVVVDGSRTVEISGITADSTVGALINAINAQVDGVHAELDVNGAIQIRRNFYGDGATYKVQLSDTGAGDIVANLFDADGTFDANNGAASTLSAVDNFTPTGAAAAIQTVLELDTDARTGLVTGINGLGSGGVTIHAANGLAAGAALIDTADTSHTTSIFVYDSLGNLHNLTVTFTRSTDPATWNWKVDVPEPASVTEGGSGQVKFRDDGSLDSLTYDGGATGLTFNPGNGAQNMALSLNAGSFGGFDGLSLTAGELNAAAVGQNGFGVGNLLGIEIDNNGQVIGNFSNGQNETLAQVLLANFSNSQGLERAGENLYQMTTNSGDVQILEAQGLGSRVSSGYLEMSNVDLSQEFTDMIITQRAFQAAAKVITTSDLLLQELVNLKR